MDIVTIIISVLALIISGLTAWRKGVKTRITHIESGFDFLSQNVRKYKGKLLIKPSKDSIRSVLSNIKQTIRKYRGVAAEILIGALNPILRGWVNYHRHIVAKRPFAVISDHLYRLLWKCLSRVR